MGHPLLSPPICQLPLPLKRQTANPLSRRSTCWRHFRVRKRLWSRSSVPTGTTRTQQGSEGPPGDGSGREGGQTGRRWEIASCPPAKKRRHPGSCQRKSDNLRWTFSLDFSITCLLWNSFPRLWPGEEAPSEVGSRPNGPVPVLHSRDRPDALLSSVFHFFKA